MNTRQEQDSLGTVDLPVGALYGPQTQRAIDNFRFSARRMPAVFIRRLALLKAACASANADLALLDPERAARIVEAAEAIAAGNYADAFPVDVFQTGSGTSTNMNINEVIATLVGDDTHPNDHVNMSQSSNDVIPSCLQLTAVLEMEQDLLPALDALVIAVRSKGSALASVLKTGRTHLMDAMPLSLQQELETWAVQLAENGARLKHSLTDLRQLPLGGTAIGTGVNCPPGFAERAVQGLSAHCRSHFSLAPDPASRMASQDVSVACSGALRVLAVTQMKIANDLRWMASGPLAGLGEITLKALQPGSSIMPGKVNPVLPEAITMVAAEVFGNDATIGVAGQSGSFQLNVMLPLIAEKLLGSIALLARACEALTVTIRDFTPQPARLEAVLERNPILATALNTRIGYDRAAAIAKRAYAEGRPVLEIAIEDSGLSEAELSTLLDPAQLAGVKPPR
jgi:fumarate hydratase class II